MWVVPSGRTGPGDGSTHARASAPEIVHGEPCMQTEEGTVTLDVPDTLRLRPSSEGGCDLMPPEGGIDLWVHVTSVDSESELGAAVAEVGLSAKLDGWEDLTFVEDGLLLDEPVRGARIRAGTNSSATT